MRAILVISCLLIYSTIASAEDNGRHWIDRGVWGTGHTFEYIVSESPHIRCEIIFNTPVNAQGTTGKPQLTTRFVQENDASVTNEMMYFDPVLLEAGTVLVRENLFGEAGIFKKIPNLFKSECLPYVQNMPGLPEEIKAPVVNMLKGCVIASAPDFFKYTPLF